MDIISVPTKDQDESNQRRFDRVIGVAIRASCEQYVCMGMSFSLMNFSRHGIHTRLLLVQSIKLPCFFFGFTSQVANTFPTLVAIKVNRGDETKNNSQAG